MVGDYSKNIPSNYLYPRHRGFTLKRYGYLYEKVYDFENLHDAYLKARKSKRYQPEVIKYTSNLEENLIVLQNELIWKTYSPRTVREFFVYIPKERLISAPAFYDRVLHHAVNNIIEPIFDSTFVYHSYACRAGKGTHAGVAVLTKYLRKTTVKYDRVYCLKCDISKYFPSIDRNILFSIIEKKIKDPDLLWLIKKILDGNQGETGIGIGSLTFQLFANVYLSELDHFIKERLRIKYYIRYMDDFIVLGPDKAELHKIRGEIEEYLWHRLRLKTNSKTQVFPISNGISFLGYRVWLTHRLLKSDTKKRIKKTMRGFMRLYKRSKISFDKIDSTIQSYLGHIKHANSYKFKRKLFNWFVLVRGNKK